jgi:iron complex outermembrane receptor protein
MFCKKPGKSNRNNKLLLIGFSLVNSSAFAVDPGYVDEADLFDDVQTVTTATRLKQKITDAPVSVTIIDSEMIEASGATEVHELFRLVPGYLSYSVIGNIFGVTSHFQPRDFGTRLEVQVNGRTVYEPLFTAVDWASLGIDLADIDYIEVVRGSSATTYGSNAFLGAINIVTKDVLSRPTTSIRSTLGNIGRKDLTLNHSGNLADINYAASLVYRSNTGFPALSRIKKPKDLRNDDRQSLHLSLQGNYVPDLHNEIKFDVGFGRTKLEVPGGDSRGYSNREHNNNYQKIKWIHKTDNHEYSLQLHHAYLGLDDDFNIGLLSDFLNVSAGQIPVLFPGHQDQVLGFGPDDTFSQRYDLEFEQKNSNINKLAYVWGAGIRRDEVKSQHLFGNGVKAENRLRLFANLDWHLNKKANINVGLLVENSPRNGSVSSPRIALNLHPSRHQTVRTSITRGKRIPSVTLRYLNTGLRFPNGDLIDVETIGSKDLLPEKMSAYEIAYIAKMPSIKTQLDVRLFREEMDDFVGLQHQPFSDGDGQVRVWDNIVDLTTQGLELQLSHKFDVISNANMRLSYAYLDTKGKQLRDTREPLKFIAASAVPKHSGTLLLTKKLPNQFDISSVLQYQSDYQNRDVGLKRVDFRIGKKLKFAHSKGKADFVIQNAFNQYNDFSTGNEFKTRAFVRFQLDY